MDIMKSYQDICREIEIWEQFYESYTDQIKALNKLGKTWGPSEIQGIDYSQPQVQNSTQIGFETFLILLRDIQEKQIVCVEALLDLENKKNKIDDIIAQLDSLDKRVVYMREIEGKTLKEIAEELGYSYDYIREVSSRNKNPQ